MMEFLTNNNIVVHSILVSLMAMFSYGVNGRFDTKDKALAFAAAMGVLMTFLNYMGIGGEAFVLRLYSYTGEPSIVVDMTNLVVSVAGSITLFIAPFALDRRKMPAKWLALGVLVSALFYRVSPMLGQTELFGAFSPYIFTPGYTILWYLVSKNED